MKLLIKIGGAQLADQAGRQALATSIRTALADGHQVILVHGGGDQIRALTKRLAIEDRYHDGLRITDAATAEAVLMVLGGQVNRQLVADLCAHGVPAVGITGADGNTFSAQPLKRAGADLGYVGAVHDAVFLGDGYGFYARGDVTDAGVTDAIQRRGHCLHNAG